jgi:hypothetical protein
MCCSPCVHRVLPGGLHVTATKIAWSMLQVRHAGCD